MRELTYLVAVSLDGFIASPDGDFSAFPMEGDHIEMLARDYADTLPAPALDALGVTADGLRFDTVLMGWNTYDVGLRQGLAEPYPHLRQYVVAAHHTPPAPSIEHVAEHPVATAQALKAEPEGAGIWLCGGAGLAAALRDEIDCLVLKVNPVVLGRGIPLFANGYAPLAYGLQRSTPFESGVVVNEYRRRPAGAVSPV
jgi:dihydrofolate reductase